MIDKQCVEWLKHHGIRPTDIRISVLNALSDSQTPLSLQQIETVLDSVDKSSVSRALALFVSHRLLHVIEDGSGSVKYELRGDNMHTHFYCEECHRTFCLKTTHIPMVDLPDGFLLHSVNYIIKGVCSDCVKNSM